MTSFFLRQLIEFLILVPSALLAYYPLKGRTRIRQPHFYLAVLLVVVGSSFV